MARAGRVLQAQADQERNCEDHVFEINVRIPGVELLLPTERTIAGLLRVVAENMDGFCAFKGATDDDLIEDGMVFRFSTEAKRDRFEDKCEKFISPNQLLKLIFTI